VNRKQSRLSLGVSALALIIATPGLALAQAANTAAAADVEQVVVTGTAIRGVAPVGSAVVSLNRATIEASGIRDAATLITNLPQGSGVGASLNTSSGRAAGVNLRGLGGNATLLLFDGHRVVSQGTQGVNADPNIIPFGIIERVEVVTDGASAVYGSDAVAGVVNYVFRRPFDGGELSARFTHTLYDEIAINGTYGKTWNGGGLIISGAYEHNTNVVRGDVPRLRQDQRPYGGGDNRYLGTGIIVNAPQINGAFIVNNQVYGLPKNLNGRVPTAAEVTPLRGLPDVVDRGDEEDYYTERERLSFVARASQDFGDLGSLSVTGMFNRRTNTAPGQGDGGFQTGGPVTIVIKPTSPYYIKGLGTGNQSVIYNFRLNNPDRKLDRNDFEDTGSIQFDYKKDLFADFRLSLGGSFGASVACATCQPQANSVLAATIADNPGGFNPYLQGPQARAEGIFGIFLQKGRQELTNFGAKIDGSLLELPAGALRIAVGSEYNDISYRQHSIYSLNPTTTWVTIRYADSKRKVKSGYAEAFVPLFGGDATMPGLQKLDLSLAIRYDDYSDFGGTTNPKAGLTWVPFNDLTLRGSFGSSFRAPTLSETNFAVSGQANSGLLNNGLNDPKIRVTNPATGQSNVLTSSLRFKQLTPETADIYSFGGDYSPSYVPGLRLSATYYSVTYKNRIGGIPNSTTALSTPEAYALYKPFFTPAPQPAGCVNGAAPGQAGDPRYATYNPLYLKYLNETRAIFSARAQDDCSLVGILDTSTQNIGQVVQQGVDLSANYRIETPIGDLSFDGAVTKILKLDRNVLPSAPIQDGLDVIGEQISTRGNARVSLRNGPWNGSVSMNYIGGFYDNNTPTINGVRIAFYDVPAWKTFDLQVAYKPEFENRLLSGTRMTFGIRNFTDEDAPIVLSGTSSNDDGNHNLWGRIYQFELTKEF
jgi:iron complex outermembrane recepter protein